MWAAAVLSFSRSWSWNRSRYPIFGPFGCRWVHSVRMCFWVSSSLLQCLHWRCSPYWFLWLAFAVIIRVLALAIAPHCFLLSLFMYYGLLVSFCCFMSSQCLVFYFSGASFCISFQNSSWFVRSSILFSISLLMLRCSSLRLYWFIISSVSLLQMLLVSFVSLFARVPSLFSSLCACMIFFLLTRYLIGKNPVSANLLVGYCLVLQLAGPGWFLVLCWMRIVSVVLLFVWVTILLLRRSVLV